MPTPLLTASELIEALSTLPDWTQDGNELTRTYKFPTYLEGIDFVSKLGHAAESMNHHPDLAVGWRKVAVRLSTHSAGGLTALDFELARKADVLAKK